MAETRRQERQHFSIDVRMDLAEKDLDDLDADGERRDARITQLKVIAGTLLVAVCTAIISAFATGLLK